MHFIVSDPPTSGRLMRVRGDIGWFTAANMAEDSAKVLTLCSYSCQSHKPCSPDQPNTNRLQHPVGSRYGDTKQLPEMLGTICRTVVC